MIEEFTPIDRHRSNVRAATIECLMEAHHLASAMAKAYREFWKPSPTLVLEMLNSNVVHWLDVLQRNTAVGITINAQLDAANLPEFPNRVPVVMPTGYAFNGTEFTYTAPAIENPEPIEDDATHGN